MDQDYLTLSSEDSSLQTDSSDASTKLEDCQIGNARIKLPQDLCESRDIFQEFFSYDTWQECFTEEQKEHLKKFLPAFPENDAYEKEETLKSLCAGENFRFGNPLNDVHVKLKNGYFRPDITKMRSLMKKAQFREYRYRQRRYYFSVMKDVLISRRRLLEAAFHQPPEIPPKADRIPPPPRTSPAEQRSRRRYFLELAAIREEVGESSQSSEDENYPEGPPPRLSKKQKKLLSTLESSYSPDMNVVTSTLASKPSGFDLEANVTSTNNPYEVTDESYKALLVRHKKRRNDCDIHPELSTRGITLQDVALRTQIAKRVTHRPSQHEPKAKKKLKVEVKPMVDIKMSPIVESSLSESESEADGLHNEIDKVEEEPKVTPKISRKRTPSVTPNEKASKNQHGSNKVTIKMEDEVANDFSGDFQAFHHGDLEGLDMMNLPMELEESHNIDVNLEEIKPTPELMQETHICFFSLVRDVICSTPDQRMTMSMLEESLRAWQESPISPLNDWYAAADSWVFMLSSAIRFLSGDYPDAQPEDFVPYIEYKPHMQAYQWIGAGRDSDNHLLPLCQYWLERRDEMPAEPIREEEGEERANSPPPPRCPTSWMVRPSTEEEKEAFREQERLRYENPHRAFTYRMHGYESVVGPVKGVYNQSVGINKPRGHSLLIADRPPFVTILALVRDATARLPNGEGTRADICELLKDSQYLAPGATESLQSVVSGALDRLHYEGDPCVKYDTKRKIWIYLHRGRTEEEFEKLHQQQGFMAKTKKTTSQRKPSRSKQKEPKENASSSQLKLDVVTAVSAAQTSARASSSSGTSASTPTITRTISMPSPTVQSLQVSTSSGIQTIQVTTQPTTGQTTGTASLLSTPLTQTVKTVTLTPTSIAKVCAVMAQGTGVQTSVAASSAGREGAKTTTVSVPTAARVAVSSEMIKDLKGVSLNVRSPGPLIIQGSGGSGSRPNSTGSAHSLPSPKAVVANVNATQLMNVSQVQLMGSRSPQQGSPKPVSSAKSIVTSAVSGVKLVNAQPTVKSITSPIGSPLHSTQAILIKQTEASQASTVPVVATQRVAVSGGKVVTSAGKTLPVNQSKPVVAKVLTNSQGQVISMESLLAHQKHGTLSQGTTLRVTGGKPGLIQLPTATPGGISQFAVVTQGNLISVAGQPRVIQAAHLTAQHVVSQAGTTQAQPTISLAAANQTVQQAKVATGKPLVAGAGTGVRMVGPGTTGGLNLAHIGGKPVLLASKTQGTPIQGAAGQNVILTTTQASAGQTVVLASQSLRAQGGTLVLQQGGAQQILLPSGFQGGTLNIKTLQGVQGLKVIPLSQTTANKGRQQVYARIIGPSGTIAGRPTTTLGTPAGTSLVQGSMTLQGGAENIVTSTTVASSAAQLNSSSVENLE